jgi:hypothetical protein
MTMHVTTHDGVYFVEGDYPSARRLGPIAVEVGGVFQHAQLRTLDDVKSAMARKVTEASGNAVIRFAYGQRSVGFWRSLLHMDDVTWYGRGEIAVLATRP